MKLKCVFLSIYSLIPITTIAMSASCISNNVYAQSNISKVRDFSSSFQEIILNTINKNNELKKYIQSRKIIQITSAGKINDRSFNQLTWEGISEFSRNVGINNSTYKETKTLSPAEIHRAYYDALNKKYNIWILTGWQHAAFFQSWIEIPINKINFDKENIKIVAIDWEVPKDLVKEGSALSLNFRTQEASFLIGYSIAKFLSEKYPGIENNNKRMINTSAGTDTSGSTNFNYGLLEGIRFWNNEQSTNDTKIFSNVYKNEEKVFLNTTYESNNPSTRNDFSLSITNGGSSIFTELTPPTIVMPVANDWSKVAADIIKDTNRKNQQWIIGVDSNMAISYGESYKDYFITSCEKRIGIATYKALCFLSGLCDVFQNNNLLTEVELSKILLYPVSESNQWSIKNDLIHNNKNKINQNLSINGGINSEFVGASDSTLNIDNSDYWANKFNTIIRETKAKFFDSNYLIDNVDQQKLEKYEGLKNSSNNKEYNLSLFELANVMYGEMSQNNMEYFNLIIDDINKWLG